MWKQILYETSLYGKGKIDETLAKLHERKHSTKEEKKEQRERTQFQARRAKPKVGHGRDIETNHVPKLQFQARRAKPKVGHGRGIETNHVPKLQFQARRAKPKVGHGECIETNHVPKLSPIAKISSIARSISERGGIASEQTMLKTPTNHKKHIKKGKGWKE
jgi:hypothetical protein